jgi:tetratricopeptide (TPR) repeat protein
LLKTRSVQVAWLFGASLGFGMLIRHFFLFHLSVPTVVFGLYMLLFQTNPRLPPSFKETPRWLLAKLRDPFVLRGLLPAALIAAGLTAAWYLSSAAAPLLTLQQRIQGGDETVIRGFGDVASHSLWWYALTAPGAISYVFTALLAVGLVLGMVRRDLASSVLVVAFVASYVFHGLQAGLGWKRFGSALAIAAALTSVGIVGIRHRRLATALSLGCIAVAAFNFAVVTWGVEPWSRSIAAALGAPLNAGTGSAGQSDMVSTGTSLAFDTCSWRINTAFCPNPPRNENWRTGDILQTILNDPECHEHTCDLTIVSKNENFNSSVFDFFRIRDFAQPTLKVRDLTAWRSVDWTMNWLLSDYVVYIPQWSSDSYAEAVTRLLESPPDLFDDSHQQMAFYSLPGGQTATLVKRTRPLTVQEAEAVIAALNLPSEELAYLLQQFDPLRVRELLDNGSVAEAFDLAMRLVESDAMNSREKAAQAVSIGNQLLNMGETARAIELLIQVAPDTDNALVWVLLGRAYAGQQNRIEAISAYGKALALDPQNYWANHLLAGLYANREAWDAVVQLERAALQVAMDDSHRVASAMRLVEAYESLGDQENACAVLQQIEQWAEEGDGRTEELRQRLGCPP